VNAMQELIAGEVPIIILYHPNRQITMRDNVTGYVYWTNHLIRYNVMSK
jgi:ABC-type transport system substrate-binding protein